MKKSERIAYLDCSSGISGDMCLGALVGAGASMPRLRRALKSIPVSGYSIAEATVMRGGLAATRVEVTVRDASSPARTLASVRKLIRAGSGLSPWVRARTLDAFKIIFEAESRAHGVPVRSAHLHELGAVDAVVDIAGAFVCMEDLGITRVHCSPVNVGSGSVQAAHGVLPVPAPATAEILRHAGAPVFADGDAELCTPTGAAILAASGPVFGPLPPMRLQSIGKGAGGRDTAKRPNALRVFVGEPEADVDGTPLTIAVIEATVDDMDPRIWAYLAEILMEQGALDVSLTPARMKKARTGMLLTVLADEAHAPALTEAVLAETTTLGVRHYTASRTVLERSIRRVRTEYGLIAVKEARLNGRVIKRSAEYEDCRSAARAHGVPIADVMRAALEASA
jgi:hypothetical protein